MTTNSGQPRTQDNIDSMVETLLKELIEATTHTKSASRTEDAITAALTEAYMGSLIPSAKTKEQATSLEIAVLAAALAPSLAQALAPQLAEALSPAIVKALNNLVSAKKTAQEQGYQEGTPGEGGY